MTKGATIPVFFAVDNRYVPYLAAALISLQAQANPADHYQIKILYQKQHLSLHNQQQLATLIKPKTSLEFVALDTSLWNKLGQDPNTLRADYLTLTIYYRLFIANLFPQYDRGIYLDADVIINHDLGYLYHLNLHEQMIGAVTDAFISHHQVTANYAEQAIGVPGKEYFNSGILLLDLKQMRACQLSQHFLYLMNKYHFPLIAPDQDYLNAIGHQRLFLLDDAWNLQTEYPLTTIKQPKIVHYNLYGKPWHYNNIAFQDLFWQALRQTPYYNQVYQEQQLYLNYPQKIQADKDHKALLLNRVHDIPQQTPTFKTAKMQGEKVQI
ncbi:MAG: glycosyltransferase family 8 protein [Bombilactobacillus sp.]